MPRCQICSFELAKASDRCANCGAAGAGGDSTLVNADFDPAELLRAAAALDNDDELATRDAKAPAESTMSYDDGSEEAAFVQQLLRGTRPSPDASGDATSVYPGPITAPADMTAEDPPALSRSRDPLAAAGFPNPDSVVDEDDAPTGNLTPDAQPDFDTPNAIDDAVANDATIQEQDLADFLDADMRAAIAGLKANAASTAPIPVEELVDEDATFEMPALVRPRGGSADDGDDAATQQLMRDEMLSFLAKPAPQQQQQQQQQQQPDTGDATVELRNVQAILPAKSTQPTKLPPIPLPPPPQPGKKMTQPTQLKAPSAAPRPAQPSFNVPAPPRPQQPGFNPSGFNSSGFNSSGINQGSQFTQQPQGSQFTQQPQGSQFTQQPQGSQFMQQPQGSQFMQQPQGSPFTQQPYMQQPQGSQFMQQPQPQQGLAPGFPQPPPAQPAAPSQQLILGFPPKLLAAAGVLAVVVVIGVVVVVITVFT